MSERYPAWKAPAAAVCVALFLSACAGKDEPAPVDVQQEAFEDLRVAVREAVDDTAREDEAIRLIDQLERDLGIMRDKIAERRRTVFALNADYDTPREEFDAYLEQVEQELRANRKRVTETQLALSKAITPEEAEEIDKARSEAMQSVIASFQST